jgi:uncharacterized membrane protein
VINLVWSHAGPQILAAFLASLVEFVEALTVILAIGSVRGWRDALGGTAAALAVLLVLVLIFGRALAVIPLGIIQVGVGALLLLFGLRWLRKAVLRFAGIIPLHDEAAAFAKEVEAMRAQSRSARAWDRVAFAGAFQITMLEGTEVVFIVIAMSAGGAGLLAPASLGAVAAFVVVAVLGLAVKTPLARVPENLLKSAVGVLLSAFGTFWFGEGIGVAWPGDDLAILPLVVGFAAVAMLAVRIASIPSRGYAR